MKDNRQAEAFLQAIHTNPEDDTPRLVYADWLEEHGDSARAEFIRVQCEKARLPRWHRRWSLLAWRERVLLARHEHVWRAELPEILGVEWGAFERGFVHEVRVPRPSFLSASADEICRAAPVRWATVTGYDADWENCEPAPFLFGLRLEGFSDAFVETPDVVFQSALSELKALDLSGVSMEGEHFAALARSPYLAKLETLLLDDSYMGNGNLRPFVESTQLRNLMILSMKGNRGGYHEDARIRPDDATLLAASPNLTRLQSLNLAANEIDTPSLQRLLASPHLVNLRELDVSDNRLTARGMKGLAAIETPLRLHRLALSRNPIGDTGAAALAKASYCAELAELELDTCEISMKGVQALAQAPWLRRLGRLNLDHNSAGADGIHALTKAFDSGELFALHLRDNEFDTEAVKLLAECPGLRGLLTLDLSENALDEEALAALSVSPHLMHLRELHLNHCTLGTRGIQSLRDAPWLANLVRLSLSDNAIGDEGLKALLGKSGLAQLNDLAVHSCSLSAVSAIVLADAELTELYRLDISANKLGGIAVEPLARSPLAASLVELDLSGNAIDDQAIIAIAAQEWPLLTTLRLAANQITDKGALALSKARFMPRLREVHCRNNRIEWRTFQQLGPRFRQY
jgi:uncharacterized protein (TIGR02996 family)